MKLFSTGLLSDCRSCRENTYVHARMFRAQCRLSVSLQVWLREGRAPRGPELRCRRVCPGFLGKCSVGTAPVQRRGQRWTRAEWLVAGLSTALSRSLRVAPQHGPQGRGALDPDSQVSLAGCSEGRAVASVRWLLCWQGQFRRGTVPGALSRLRSWRRGCLELRDAPTVSTWPEPGWLNPRGPQPRRY